MKKNYKSDFDIILTLKTCVRHEDGTCDKRDVGWPEHDWAATFRTENGLREYVASRKGDALVNCFNDNGRIHVVFNNHRLGKGGLRVDFHSEIPNAIYPDGIQDLYEPQPLDIELVDGPGDCAGAAEVEVLLPYIKGDRGEKLTYGDLTEQDKEDLIAPIKESINKAIEEKQDKLSVTADFDLKENLLSLTDTGKRRLFDDMWASINGTKLANGNYRMGADGKELTYAEALVRYERNGFIQKWNRECSRTDKYLQTVVYGKYNEATGYFELNGLTDITYEQAQSILKAGRPRNASDGVSIYSATPIRTNLPWEISIDGILSSAFFAASQLEVARFIEPVTISGTYFFYNNSRLHTVLGTLVCKSGSSFHGCSGLKNITVRLATAGGNYWFSSSSQLSFDSVKCMIDNTTVACTITFHPDVYAKLTGDTTNEAAAALTEEELAQWVAITEAAAAKNISFATV